MISVAAHWLQQEKPDEVNGILVPWLENMVC
jgi:pimeloyl-ACP methyl ester carboxylesterase